MDQITVNDVWVADLLPGQVRDVAADLRADAKAVTEAMGNAKTAYAGVNWETYTGQGDAEVWSAMYRVAALADDYAQVSLEGAAAALDAFAEGVVQLAHEGVTLRGQIRQWQAWSNPLELVGMLGIIEERNHQQEMSGYAEQNRLLARRFDAAVDDLAHAFRAITVTAGGTERLSERSRQAIDLSVGAIDQDVDTIDSLVHPPRYDVPTIDSSVFVPGLSDADPSTTMVVEVDPPRSDEQEPGGAPDSAKDAGSPASGGGTTYTVAPGDSLWAIAESQLGDGNRWTEIAAANGSIADPNLLMIGMALTLPATGGAGGVVPVAVSATGPI